MLLEVAADGLTLLDKIRSRFREKDWCAWRPGRFGTRAFMLLYDFQEAANIMRQVIQLQPEIPLRFWTEDLV